MSFFFKKKTQVECESLTCVAHQRACQEALFEAVSEASQRLEACDEAIEGSCETQQWRVSSGSQFRESV